ncbi:MAG: DHH family phosphoesterase [Cyanobacteriota bacterium]
MLDTTQVNRLFSTNQVIKKQPVQNYQPYAFAGRLSSDTLAISKPKNNVIAFGRKGKAMNVVTFTGLKDPLDNQKPAIQMKVRGVMAHQYIENGKFPAQDYNVNTLAGERVVDAESGKPAKPQSKRKGRGKQQEADNSPKKIVRDDKLPRWKDGQVLNYQLKIHPKQGPQIILSAPGIGTIGRVHDEVAEVILPVLFANPDDDRNSKPRPDFQFELSNMVAGTTKGAETIGLRANLKYTGDNPEVDKHVRDAFDTVLNNPECADKVLLYQEKTSPEEVLKKILDYENKVNGAEAKQEMETVIGNIVKELKDPANKRILLLGHCKPDGDTIGCVLGMKNALALMDPSKKVDCAVDDKIPGLFRHKMPGIDGEMKRPFNPERIQALESQVKDLKGQEQTERVKDQIVMLERELEVMKDKSKLLDPKAEYDLVITMDIPTPKRFTDKFKQYFDSAKKVIYIDHHPHRLEEWQSAASDTGLNIQNIHDNKLAWIADAVPAATQLVAIIGNKLLPDLASIANGEKKAADVFNKPGQMDHLKAYVASLITGASTDTGSYTRTANLLPEHIKNPETGEPVPVQQRPNFLPEGIGKWLMDVTDGAIDKKWLREEITWDISDQKTTELDESARDIMLKYCIEGKEVTEDLSLGIIQVDYDQMNQVWQAQMEVEPDTTLLDIQNAYKYSEAMGVLRSDPALSGDHGKPEDKPTEGEPTLREKATENYTGPYDTDRIAILICQDKKAGELDEKLQTANQNGLRLSLRSVEGSIHAELLASLFGGGGHGGAAGGRVDLPGVDLNTPLGVEIEGKIETSYAKVLEVLKSNYEVMRNNKIPPMQKKSMCKEIKVVSDPNGVPCKDLIKNVVTEIRAEQVPDAEKEETAGKDKKKVRFMGNMINMFQTKAS